MAIAVKYTYMPELHNAHTLARNLICADADNVHYCRIYQTMYLLGKVN